MTIKPEVLAAIENFDGVVYPTVFRYADWALIRAELLAMDAEVDRLAAERKHLIDAMHNSAREVE